MRCGAQETGFRRVQVQAVSARRVSHARRDVSKLAAVLGLLLVNSGCDQAEGEGTNERVAPLVHSVVSEDVVPGAPRFVELEVADAAVRGSAGDAVGGARFGAAWVAAKSGELQALVRLAQDEGAKGLLDGLEKGGWMAFTALRALPHASDAVLAWGRLCEVAAVVPPAQAGAVLQSLHAMVARPPGATEAIGVSSERRCAELMPRLNARSDLAPHDRDLVRSIHRMLAEHRTAAPAGD